MDYTIPLAHPINREQYFTYDLALGMPTGDSSPSSIRPLAPFCFLKSFLDSAKELCKSIQICDKEQIIEQLTRIFNLPIGIASAFERFLSLITLLIRGFTIATISIGSAILGFIFLSIELGLEITRLIRAVCFDNKHQIKNIRRLLEWSDSTDEALQALQKNLVDKTLNEIFEEHFSLSAKEIADLYAIERDPSKIESLAKSKLQTKINSLVRRIQPSAVKEFYTYMSNESMRAQPENGRELIKRFDTQLDKTVLVHFVGIVAISLAIISLALTFVFASPLIPITIGLIGAAIEFSRYLAPSAFLNQKGYHISFTACLPKCLQPRPELPCQQIVY